MTAVDERVLFVNHTAHVSGAEYSLLDLLRGLPDGVAPAVACPPGGLTSEVAALGVPTVGLHGTDAGLKLHPVGTPRALGSLAADGMTLLKEARRRASTVLHANSTRAALACAVTRRLGGPPLAVHVHDVLGADWVSAVVRSVIARTADVVLANSEHVRASFDLDRRVDVVVVDNPVDLSRFDPERADGDRVRRELGLRGDEPVLSVIGQITPWKGQDTAIRALARMPDRFGDARLLVVGEPVFATAATRYDNESYLAGLRSLAVELGVDHRVMFLGGRRDIADVLAATDLALLPSWEEPFGRVVIEAMAMRVPVIATRSGGPAEILSAGGGVLLPPVDPGAWATAMGRLLDDPRERTRLGATGRRLACERYGLERFVARVLDAYSVARTAVSPGSGAA